MAKLRSYGWGLAILIVASVPGVSLIGAAERDKVVIGSDKQTGGPTQSDVEAMERIKQQAEELKQRTERERQQREQQRQEQERRQQDKKK